MTVVGGVSGCGCGLRGWALLGVVWGGCGGALRRRVYRRGEDRILGGMIICMGRKEIKV